MKVIDTKRKLLYIDFAQILPQQTYSTIDTMMSYQGVVFDLRGYPHWVLYSIMNQLTDPTPFAFVRNYDYRAPGYVVESFMTCGLKRKYTGKLVVLVNEQTQSLAEFTVMALQTIPELKVVGSQTAGTDGDVRSITLPGGISMFITSIGIYYPDKTQTQRKGVRIDVIAKPTIAGIRAGRDEVLEKGVEVLREMIKAKK
jgi:carboxyl-terminal processing protease